MYTFASISVDPMPKASADYALLIEWPPTDRDPGHTFGVYDRMCLKDGAFSFVIYRCRLSGKIWHSEKTIASDDWLMTAVNTHYAALNNKGTLGSLLSPFCNFFLCTSLPSFVRSFICPSLPPLIVSIYRCLPLQNVSKTSF